MTHTYGDKRLSFHELETALKRGVDPDYLQALTPNMMLLGRANNDVPLKSYEDTEFPLARLEYVS